MTELTCICCPMGCRLKVDEENDYAVTGNTCKRGEQYGKDELRNPTRVITTTVDIIGGTHHRCPVRTNGAIPKRMMFDAVNLLRKVHLTAPVECGKVIMPDILGTGIDVIATKGIDICKK